jgi:UDP-N-acetylglucosamine 2-epimerase (non-hydrolysing)
MDKSFAIIFGTRPEYLKMKSIILEFKKQNIFKFKVIYITQHETINEDIDESIIKLNILNNSNNRLNNIGSEILTKLPFYINDITHIIVQGDTSTAFYSALSGFQLNKKIIHIEAGLRTYDIFKPFPEECYRQMISRMASINFTPHNDSSIILKNENVFGEIINVGNTILDLVNSYNLKCSMDNIVLITFHRRENWDKVDELLVGLKKLVNITPNITYIWYLHMNPDLQKKVKQNITNIPSIILKEPSNHISFTKEISRSNFIITDSGGVQEEASFLGKHCIVLRASTERTHIPKEYITILEDYTKLDNIYHMIAKTHLSSCNVYGYGNSSKLILDFIQNINNL